MDSTAKKRLASDPDGLLTYEYIANNIDRIADDMPQLVDNMMRVDHTGQFCVSAARFLHAIDPQAYAEAISTLVEAATDRDRDRAYIGSLLPAIWGEDYETRAEELNASDRNFRRIYKRLHPSDSL